jgi:hypothetical protein
MYTCDKVNAELLRHNRLDVTCLDDKKKVGDSYEFRFRCAICGNDDWWALPKHILRHNYRCLKCYENQPDKYVIKHGRAVRKNHGLTKEQVIEKVAKVRNDVILEDYAGNTHNKSTWKCIECGGIWYDTVGHIAGDNRHRIYSYCPHCHVNKPLQYRIDHKTLDSRWEIVYYLYHILHGHRIFRLHKEIPLPYYFENRRCFWYPDFILFPHVDLLVDYPQIFQKKGEIIEVKPKSGGRRPEQTQAKKESGWDVAFVGWDKIKPMWDWLLTQNVDIDKYLVKK